MKSEDIEGQNKLLIKQKKTDNGNREEYYLGKKNKKRKITKISSWN